MEKLNLILHRTLKKKIKGQEVDMDTILNNENCPLVEKERHKVVKVLMLCLLGEFFGFHTISEMLKARQITGSKVYDAFNLLSYKDLTNLSADLFLMFADQELRKLGCQSDSSWSRADVTYIIDHSIYKQWLTKEESEYYQKFFSGQTGKVEYGFRLTVGGIAINETFYPLAFLVSSKTFSDGEVAQIVLACMHSRIKELAHKQHLTFGTWYLSVDNGFNDIYLFKDAVRMGITPICVPKKCHYFTIDDVSIKLSEFIEKEFLEKEKEYKQANPQSESPFSMRKRAHYRAKDIDVILLIFRLKDSNKISVIFTTDLNIKAKTLRHRWFQRTHIEQFFRMSKHTLQFAQSHCRGVNDFIEKICINFLKVSICLSIRNQCRKYKEYKRLTFGTIRLLVINYRIGEDLFNSLLNYDYSL